MQNWNFQQHKLYDREQQRKAEQRRKNRKHQAQR